MKTYTIYKIKSHNVAKHDGASHTDPYCEHDLLQSRLE